MNPSAPSRFCAHCGAAIKEAQKFCASCGAPAPAPAVAPALAPVGATFPGTPAPARRSRAKIVAGAVAVVAVVAAGGIGGAFLLGGSSGVQKDSQGREVIAGVVEEEPTIAWSQDLSEDQWVRVMGGRLVLSEDQRSTVQDLEGNELYDFDGRVMVGNDDFLLTTPDDLDGSADGYVQKIVLLQADTGEELWRADTEAHDESAFRFTSHGLLTNAGEEGDVAMLDLKNGEKLWGIDDVKTYVGLWEEGNFVAAVTERDELVVLDMKGEERMRVDLDLGSDTYPELSISGDTVAVKADLDLRGFSVETGKEIWQEEIDLPQDYTGGHRGSFNLSAMPGGAMLVEVYAPYDDEEEEETIRFVMGADGEKRDYRYEAGAIFLFEEDGEEYAYLGGDESLVINAQLEKIARVNDVQEHVKGGFYTLDDDRVGYVPFGDSKEAWTYDLDLDSETYPTLYAVPDAIVVSWSDEIVVLK